jgi:hypothetical protein
MPNLRLSADTISQARSVSIDKVISDRQIKLRGNGAERVGPCPNCGGTDRFAVNTKKNVFNCRGCGGKGDAIALVRFLDGVTFNDAVISMTGGNPIPSRPSNNIVRSPNNVSGKKIIAIYDYRDDTGELLYQAVRYQPKDFRQRIPDGKGGWIDSLESLKGKRVLYKWPDLVQYPDATVFVYEGEKDADRVASLNQCATTIAGDGHWTPDCIEQGP